MGINEVPIRSVCSEQYQNILYGNSYWILELRTRLGYNPDHGESDLLMIAHIMYQQALVPSTSMPAGWVLLLSFEVSLLVPLSVLSPAAASASLCV